jgi:tRNA threonylcarbamoyladenosine biosynthesis protein TsaE
MTQRTVSNSPAETEALGEALGKRLKGGETIELVSDLGGGKTTLVRGLARGFGSPDRVASPTFTLSRVYKRGQQELHHFDFYRLQDGGLTGYELAEVIDDPQRVVVVEWGQVIEDILPPDRLRVTISHAAEDRRQLELDYPKRLAYLVEDLA